MSSPGGAADLRRTAPRTSFISWYGRQGVYSFRIIRLDIFQGYFFGEVEFRADRFKANIQSQRRGRILRLPFQTGQQAGEKVLVRMTGGRHPDELFVEDYLAYGGRSEWLEIDSDEITFFLADHQDQLDTIEITDGR